MVFPFSKMNKVWWKVVVAILIVEIIRFGHSKMVKTATLLLSILVNHNKIIKEWHHNSKLSNNNSKTIRVLTRGWITYLHFRINFMRTVILILLVVTLFLLEIILISIISTIYHKVLLIRINNKSMKILDFYLLDLDFHSILRKPQAFTIFPTLLSKLLWNQDRYNIREIANLNHHK
jgi:hypothetical protein